MSLSDRTWRERIIIKDLDKVKNDYEVLKRYVATLKFKIISLELTSGKVNKDYIVLLEKYNKLVVENELIVAQWEVLVEDINLKEKVN